jgi:hypothetical protein
MYFNLSYEKKTPDLTLEELKKKMAGEDLNALIHIKKNVDLEDLWDSYCSVMYVKNPIGIICIPGTENNFKIKILENSTPPFFDPKNAFAFNHEEKTKKGGTRSNKKKSKRNQKGGLVLPENLPLIRPTWDADATGSLNTLTQLRAIYGANSAQVFGSSLPSVNVGQEAICFQQLAFYMYRHEIRRIISFQACALNPGGNHAGTYDPAYSNMENQTWNILKRINNANRLDANYRFQDMLCQDMTAGTINFWNDMNVLNFEGDNNRTLIHCLAGFGRTGAALLFIALKEHIVRGGLVGFNPAFIQGQYLGNGNSAAMYAILRAFLTQRIGVSTDPINGIYQGPINNFNIARTINEVFNIVDVFHANLLIQRLNYMFIIFGQQFLPAGPGRNIYTYPLHVAIPPGGINVNNVFRPPILIAI